MKDSYKTISASSEGEYKEKGSKFFAYAFPVETEEDWQVCAEKVRKLHSKARHHCFAFEIGIDGNNYRANDDGEPSGTAGKPILGQIRSFELTNVFIVVVRYFGGTLLGASGLIRSYKTAAADALENAEIIEKTVSDIYRFTFDYAIMSDVMNAVKKQKLEIVFQKFENEGLIDVAIRQSEVEDTMVKLKAAIAKIHLEMVADLEKIEGLEIEYLETR